MSRVYEISFKLGAQMAGNFAKTMSSTSGALGQINEKISEIGKQQAAINSLVKMRKEVLLASREYSKARENVEKLAAELRSSGAPTREMINNFEKAKRAVSSSKASLDKKRDSLRQLTASTDAAGKSTKYLIDRQNQLAASAEKAKKAQSGLQKTMSAMSQNEATRANAKGQMLDAAALAVTLAAPIRSAIQFESSMADVNKVVDQTKQQSKEMSSEIVNMSRRIPMAASALAQIVASGGQAGLARDELLAFAESAAKMGVAFDITAEQSGDMMAVWRTAFGLGQDGVVALADQINYLSNTSAASAPNISDVVTRVGGLGKIAGLNSGQVAALAGALVAVGAPSEVAATGLQNMMLALTAGESATNAQKDAFEALGFQAEEMAAMMQKDAQGAILSVLNAVKKLDAEKQPAVLTEIFGKESIKSIGQLLNKTDLLAENFEKVGNASKYSGSMQKEFASRSATTANNMQLLGNRVTALGISLGNILLPGLNAVIGPIGAMVDLVADLANKYPTVTTAIVAVTAALIAMKVAVVAGTYAYTFLRGAWLSAKAVLLTLRVAYLLHTGALVASTNATKAALVISKAMTAAQWLFNAALTANPIGLVIAAIAALVAAGIWLYKNWDTVVAFLTSAWESFKAAFLSWSPVQWVMDAFSKVMDFFSNLSLADSGYKLMQTLADGLLSAATLPIKAVEAVLGKVRNFLPFSDAKTGPLSELTKSGAAIMTTLGDGMKSAGSSAMSSPFSQASKNMIGGAIDNLSGPARGSAASGPTTYEVTQNLYFGSDTSPSVVQKVREAASAGGDDLIKKMRQAEQEERRLSYA
jgi:TP901 family phage tail tape measure protein